jgi:hypothetical protein
MAASQQYAIGATAVPIASAPAEANVVPGPTAWFSLSNGSGGSIYLGGANVSSSNGYPMALSTALTGYLFPGDVLYAVQNSGASTVSILVTGV